MKLHPLSAVTQGLRRGLLAASFVFFLFAMGSNFLPSSDQYFGLVFVLFPVVFVLGVGYQIAYYRRFEYDLTADTFDISAGVFGRKEREIPYRRIQNVDITESLFHRILGMAVVDIETAGGSETEAKLDFVTATEARRIQQEVRQRRRAPESTDTSQPPAQADESAGSGAAEGARTPGQPATGTGGEPTRQPDGPATEADPAGGAVSTDHERESLTPTLLFALDIRELLLLSLISFRAASIVVLLVGLPFAQDFFVNLVVQTVGVELDAATLQQRPDLALVTGLVALVLGIVSTWVLSAVLSFVEYYDFTLVRQGDDLVYERGLLQRYSGSIPTDKVQTITLQENVLMRAFGYAALTVETAGYSPGQSQSGGAQSAIPLADRDRTLSLARSLEPFDDLEFTRPPKRARRRYAVRFGLVVLALAGLLRVVAAFVSGFTLWWLPLVLLPLVVPAAHLRWRHRGYHVGDNQFVVRSGFWRQTTRVIPYYRLQTVFRERTIFQRRLGLAHLTADTATSSLLGARDATAFDIEAEDARRLYELTRERLQTSVRERATA
jgi:putative membrane protein